MEHREADVCVVGAGFAGLAAARSLITEGKTVVVLEARDRVGGRVWDKTLEDGSVVSVGGTWIGQRQDRIRALVEETRLSLYPQYFGDVDPDDPGDPLDPFDRGAETILRLDGVNHRYKGMAAPIGIEALASVGLAFEQLKAIADTVPVDRPWETPNAYALDSQTLGGWIASELNVPFEKARIMIRTALSLLFSSDPAEVSLLGSMLLARGNKEGFQYYADASFTETHLVDGGGVPEVARRLGDALGDALRKSTPVRRIEQNADSVEVFGDDISVRAKYAIVTAPPVVASQIEYHPPLPPAHTQLMQKMAPGAIYRFVVVYKTPFWRAKGLSGETVGPQSPILVSIDQCPKTPEDGSTPKGVLSCYAISRTSAELALMDKESRKQLVLSELALRLGNEALEAIAFSETDWTAEQWSRGGMISHLGPGVLTSYGSVLHEPAGRIYWAGAERATEMHGLIEGAIRSGEKAVADILAQMKTPPFRTA
ncbi:MAG: flavin monoamine oxidase family protein [Thermoanaerobaculia bacterium]